MLKDTYSLLSVMQCDMYHAYRENYMYLQPFAARKIYESLNIFDERSNYVFMEYGNGNCSNVLNALDACYTSIESTCVFLKDYANKFKQNGLKSKVFGTLRHIEVAMDHFEYRKKVFETLSNTLQFLIIKTN